jgi:hypothetical protein
MELANNETYGPHILMRFDLGTTKMEMHNIIEKDFSETAELQVLDHSTLSYHSACSAPS